MFTNFSVGRSAFFLINLNRKMSFWARGLLTTMKDPAAIVIQTPKLVAFRDKYPKAKHHILICPYEDIDSMNELTRDHIDLVEEMQELALRVIESQGQVPKNFIIGFHAIPSMSRLHLHVISRDFISPCLKKSNHWNSFTTSFMVTPEKVIEDLRQHGRVLIDEDEMWAVLATPLTCHSCSYKAKNMPDLKRHLQEHESMYEN